MRRTVRRKNLKKKNKNFTIKKIGIEVKLDAKNL